jgi:hypothetical protein
MNLLRMLRYDLSAGFAANRTKLLLSVLVVMLIASSFAPECQNAIAEVLPDGNAVYFEGERSIVDYLIYLYKGIEVYVPGVSNPFMLPIFWLSLQILVALLVGMYPNADLRGYAPGALVRAGGKRLWWVSKACWVVLTVVAFYLLSYLATSAIALAMGDTQLLPTSNASLLVNGINAQALSLPELALLLLVPVAASIALALAQMTLSFVLNPALAFISVMAFCLASAYYHVRLCKNTTA